jgi:hypothetical protein
MIMCQHIKSDCCSLGKIQKIKSGGIKRTTYTKIKMGTRSTRTVFKPNCASICSKSHTKKKSLAHRLPQDVRNWGSRRFYVLPQDVRNWGSRRF